MLSPSLPSKIVKVAAAILEKEGKFLITRRHRHSHLGHLWEFPGGKLEVGETPQDCIIRECKEEIGLEIRPLHLYREVEHCYPEVSVHLYFFICQIISGKAKALDCAGIAWASPEELKNYEFPDADLQLIEDLSRKTPAIL